MILNMLLKHQDNTIKLQNSQRGFQRGIGTLTDIEDLINASKTFKLLAQKDRTQKFQSN